MKRTIVSLTAFLLLSCSAFASGNTCIGGSGCSTTNNDNATATAAATGGNATNTVVNAPVVVQDADYYTRIYNKPRITTNVDTTDVNVNAVKVDTRDYNTNKQKQGQAQFQGQDQDQRQTQKVEDSGNSSIVWNERRQTAQAWAAPTAIASDSCGTSVGAGGQGPAFGFSFNFARDDEVCELIKLSRRVGELGYGDGAIKLLCQDERVAAAMPAQCGTKE